MKRKDEKIQTHFIADRRYITERELSKLIQKSTQGLQQDRFKRQGLPYIKYGGKIYYDLLEVHKFMKDHTIRPEV